MAIVKLKKITLYTLSKNLKTFLNRLQDLGVMHVISLTNKTEQIKVPESERKAKEALQFLLSAPLRRGQVHTKKTFDAHSVKTETLKLKNSLQRRTEEREALKKRIKDIKPWGDFSYNTRKSSDPYKLWFYQIPHRKLSILEGHDLIWQNCGKDHRFYYIVVIAEQKPQLPFKRTHIGVKSLSLLQDQLEDIENEIEEIQAKRIALTRWLDLYIKEMHRLENMEHYEQVHNEVYEDDTVMVIQGWVPANDLEALQTFDYKNHAAFLVEEPQTSETPPTLLKNKNLFSAGENLLTFYTVPNYFEHDTSAVIFFSFVLFFGMILGDAGYGILLGVMTLIFYKKMQQSKTGKRFVPLLLFLSLATIVWGMMVGSYFGTPPPENSWLSALQFFDINDYDTMMKISVFIGALHIIIANILKAIDLSREKNRLGVLAPIGWIISIIGGLLYYIQVDMQTLSTTFMASGMILVLLFSAIDTPWTKRIFSGTAALMQVTTLFGDILSYLRLFALGLATASMGMAFNQLAMQVSDTFPGIGVLFALMILIIGHLLNFTLGIVSGVVHGLRLNLIEFLKYDSKKEGYAFDTFKKKE